MLQTKIKFNINATLQHFNEHLDPQSRVEVRHLRGLRQLHLRRLSRNFGSPPNWRKHFRGMGSGLHQNRRMLRRYASNGFGYLQTNHFKTHKRNDTYKWWQKRSFVLCFCIKKDWKITKVHSNTFEISF